MARQIIDVGAVANDGTGDPLRDAYTKSNANFAELYGGLALVDSWTFSSAVSEVVFDDLGGYSSVMVLARGLTMSASGLRNLQVSSDNGSTWHSVSGDYVVINTSGVETAGTLINLHGTSTTAARSGIVMISAWNRSAQKIVMHSQTTAFGVITQAVPLDALRVVTSTGNFAAGSIYVFASGGS